MEYAKLTFTFGSMGAGKTKELIESFDKDVSLGRKAIILVPSIDTRSADGFVESRNGEKRNAIPVNEAVDVYTLVKSMNPDVLYYDEIQFNSSKTNKELIRIVDELNVTVHCYGLRSDFKTDYFKGSLDLFLMADEVRSIEVACKKCEERHSIINMRVSNGRPVFDGDQVEVGGDDKYVPCCRRCYIKAYKEANGYI